MIWSRLSLYSVGIEELSVELTCLWNWHVLQKQILSVLNLGVPAWDSLLTEQEKEDFERVLKTGLKIIWGKDYSTFDTVIKEGQISTMRQVREKIVKKFVKKTIKHIKFKRWFSEHDSAGMNTRTGNRAKFKTVPARKAFFQKSPIPTITNLANLLTKHKWQFYIVAN